MEAIESHAFEICSAEQTDAGGDDMRYAALLFSIILITGISVAAVALNPCPDGTAYGTCANKTGYYGQYCTGLATSTNIPHLEFRPELCPCPSGWTVNGTTNCILMSGCQYGNPACAANQTCNNATGVCVLKTGCAYSNPACDASHDCTNNNCTLKQGCDYSNPACNASNGELCVSNQCTQEANWCNSDSECGSSKICTSNHCVDDILVGGGDDGSGDTGDLGGWEEEEEQSTAMPCCCPGLMVILAGAALFVMKE